MTRLLPVALLLALALPALAAPATPPAAEWTVMVYLNADNNLDEFGVKDVQEMEKAGPSKQVNVVVLLDRENQPTRLYDVAGRAPDAKADDWGLRGRRIGQECEADMGQVKTLVDFATATAASHPAKHYLLVLWNHGSGWEQKGLCGPARGISYDDQSGNHLSTTDLRVTLGAIQKKLGRAIDVVGMDACLMQMLEVAYEIRENAGYFVGSEETEPGDGWPYDLILKPLVANPALAPDALAQLISEAYGKYYLTAGKSSKRRSSGDGTTQSAIDLSRVGELADALDALAARLAEIVPGGPEGNEPLRNARREAVSFYYSDNIDLGQLVGNLARKTADPATKKLAERFLAVYGKAVLRFDSTGQAFRDATGLAIYFPDRSPNADYQTLAFAERRWDDLVGAYLATNPDLSTGNGGGYDDGGTNDPSPDDQEKRR